MRLRHKTSHGSSPELEEVVQVYGFCIPFSGDIRYDNRSYAVVIQRKICARRQISAPSVPSCVCANELSFKICVFEVVKGPHSCQDRCYCSCRYVRMVPVKAGSSLKPLKLVRFKRPYHMNAGCYQDQTYTRLKICFCAF